MTIAAEFPINTNTNAATRDTANPQTAALKLSPGTAALLRCPCCTAPLAQAGAQLHCTNNACAKTFPIVDGVPVLINESNSIFDIGDFTAAKKNTFFEKGKRADVIDFFDQRLPSIDLNLQSRQNYERFAQELLKRSANPRVLVIGGSILGVGMEALTAHPQIELVGTDIGYGPLTQIIMDAHDICFDSGAFDGVIAQAVLEHVVDPHRCAAEMHRVLKANGLIYAETPFMQQVHGGRYDFTRWTHLGHRRLFRHFAEIDSGVACGPGMALAWSQQYFLLGFARSQGARAVARAFTRLTGFLLKYLDRVTVKNPSALDAASGVYFMGTKSNTPLPDRELIRQYRGGLING